ncbi:hypothetical protein [Janthinobacterium sp. SUN033]|uniref:hypothetical protein n=1 Tax=Janthinobacterium sp. SUN033 TaxID=3002439 RepID=UPI0025AF6BF2|nr:hypothetical protein [Janthinobacterium sp. SUN033]MDN2678677.1 hypothetical protein [Janthinobacterium sp. SUN033]
MKKLLTFVLIVMLACLFLDKISGSGSDMHMQFNGDDVDGPLEWLFGLVFAGGGLLIAAIAVVCAAVITGVVLAGVGVVLIAVVALCVVLALALSTPVLLPLLIPVAIVWLIVSRNRKQAQAGASASAQPVITAP